MRKKLLLITLLALSLHGLSAQGLLSHLNDTTSRRTLFERVANIEKKNNLFNLKLHMQTTFNGTFTDGTFEQAAFKMNQLRLEARGDLNDWLSYRWRQRLNSSNTPHALDNLPSSIDYAMISVRLTDKLVTSIGKQAAAYGGFEYDLDPIEIYQYSALRFHDRYHLLVSSHPNPRTCITNREQPNGFHGRYLRATPGRRGRKPCTSRLHGQLERQLLQRQVENPLVILPTQSGQRIQQPFLRHR